MIRKKIISLTALISLFGVGVGTFGTVLFRNNKTTSYVNKEKSKEEISDKTNNKVNEKNKLIASQANSQNTFLSAKTGPIVYWGSKISSLDWFGGERWSIDLDTMMDNPYKEGDWKRSWFNYDYDRTNNILYILTSGSSRSNAYQRLLAIDVETGKDVFTGKEISTQNKISYVNFPQKNSDVRFLTVLKNGNVLMYGGAKTGLNDSAYLYEKDKKTIMKIQHNFQTLMDKIKKPKNSKWYFFNLIPVSNNRNLVEIVNFTTVSGPEIGNNPDDANFNVYFILVDDNLNIIQNNGWTSPALAANGISGYKNSKITPQRDYYYFADGKVVTVIYNRIIIVDPNNGVTFKSSKLSEENKWVLSWTFDSGENLFFKYKDDGFIYSSSSTSVKSTPKDTLVNLDTYFDINSYSQNDINKYSKDYILYNVHGYYGQIMMLNSYFYTDPNFPNKTEQEIIDNKYGLAVAITSNENNPLFGDIKGLLNTDDAFIKSSDFTIDNSILNNKLPSEISRQDLTITNDGFFTRNPEKKEDGTLKYPQFVKEVINDNEKKDGQDGNLKITANIDQIPWFVNNNVMPSDIAPLTITKWFNTSNYIQSRVNWKDVSLDYDFKNTIPSKVTLDDVKRFDPFDINLTSQNTTISGINYPTKNYKFENQNDNDGTITIKAVVTYLPIDVEAKKENLITQEFSHKYQIFKKTDDKSFNYIGNKNDSSEENIKNIPQLKELSESNLLPSSFEAEDTSSILKFINTDSSKGYPLSKMKFSITTNDINGTLTISGKLQDGYYEDNYTNKEFTKTYTGLNRISDYSFNVNSNPMGFNKKDYFPSDIDEQIIYKFFANYNGFNLSDIKLSLIPNDVKGELSVRFNLDKTYPESVANNVGFLKQEDSYIKEFVIDGFKTTKEYEEQYSVKFKDDNSKDFDQIKKYTPNQIKQILKKETKEDNKLYIGNQEIKSEMDFAKNVVEKYGSKIPKELTNENFEQHIYYNDPNGEITVKLVFKSIEGLSNELVFIQRFTGFAKGNQVPTDDILSFKTESKLFSDNEQFTKVLPSSIKKSLDDVSTRKDMIDKFLSFYSGDYKKMIDKNNFNLDVVADDIFGYITIKISFNEKDITNKQSLLSYTATYNGFLTE
ncbi:lipoprotein 17-related variable surface protein [Malacoplasma iowae]|uniref:lipoprotein 17-related variable surface protein n=1 Tax=Malacoplasma iowae TaxID=2116 RepID=UPI003872C1AB|nr:lipoprotein 17-related variable surface protein [Malacoplasma iowae]